MRSRYWTRALLISGKVRSTICWRVMRFSWSHQRGKETKSYDLRPLILQIELLGVSDGAARLSMHLRNDERGAGRPEQVMLALGATEEPTRMHRTAIELAQEPVSA